MIYCDLCVTQDLFLTLCIQMALPQSSPVLQTGASHVRGFGRVPQLCRPTCPRNCGTHPDEKGVEVNLFISCNASSSFLEQVVERSYLLMSQFAF